MKLLHGNRQMPQRHILEAFKKDLVLIVNKLLGSHSGQLERLELDFYTTNESEFEYEYEFQPDLGDNISEWIRYIATRKVREMSIGSPCSKSGGDYEMPPDLANLEKLKKVRVHMPGCGENELNVVRWVIKNSPCLNVITLFQPPLTSNTPRIDLNDVNQLLVLKRSSSGAILVVQYFWGRQTYCFGKVYRRERRIVFQSLKGLGLQFFPKVSQHLC